MRTPDISPSSPNTATSILRRQLHDGVKRFGFPPESGRTRRSGERACATEEKVRADVLHVSRNLDVVLQAGLRAGFPLDGPHGAMQIFDRGKFAARVMWGALPSAYDLSAASLAETYAQAQVDLLQVRRLDQLNAGELEDLAAGAERHAEQLQHLALSARTRAHDLACDRAAGRAALGLRAYA